MDHVAPKTVAIVFLARFKRVGHMTLLDKDTKPIRDPLSVRLGPRFSLFQCLKYDWAPKLPNVKKISIDLHLHLCILYLRFKHITLSPFCINN